MHCNTFSACTFECVCCLPYLRHRRSCCAQWSRHRLRSTSLSSGSPYESLYRSHNWRRSGCSPECPPETVRPGQPWLPVCHKTVRITSPSKHQVRLVLSTNTQSSLSLYPARAACCSATSSDQSPAGCLSSTVHSLPLARFSELVTYLPQLLALLNNHRLPGLVTFQ